MPTRRRLRGAAATLATLGLLLSACGTAADQDTDAIVADAQARDAAKNQTQVQQAQARNDALPTPVPGTVRIDGNTGSLTPDELAAYRRTGTTDDVRATYRGEDRAFAELCSGSVDLVDSSRPISREEWDACRAVGLDVVQLQVASDAIVVAIKSESDVGGDCLSTDQVREVYRAGSPVMRWSQLGDGFDDVPLEVAGPMQDSHAFAFFGRALLDATQPSMTTLRSDYHAFDSEAGTRIFTVGNGRDELLAATVADRNRVREQAKSDLEATWQVINDAKAEVQIALAEQAKGVRDQRPAYQQLQDRQRVDAAYAALASAQRQARAAETAKDAASTAWQRADTAAQRVERARGRVGYYRFSYYGLFQDQLRPFEITSPDGERNCIFPSQDTITSGQYPLSRRMLITTTTRSLARGEVSDFLQHYLDHATAAATEAGMVALPSDTLALQRRWVEGKESPTLVSLTEAPGAEPSTATSIPQPAR